MESSAREKPGLWVCYEQGPPAQGAPLTDWFHCHCHHSGRRSKLWAWCSAGWSSCLGDKSVVLTETLYWGGEETPVSRRRGVNPGLDGEWGDTQGESAFPGRPWAGVGASGPVTGGLERVILPRISSCFILLMEQFPRRSGGWAHMPAPRGSSPVGLSACPTEPTRPSHPTWVPVTQVQATLRHSAAQPSLRNCGASPCPLNV